jgi:hypothetical protein
MTDPTRSRRVLRTVISAVAILLFLSVFLSDSPAYTSGALFSLWIVPATFGAVIAGAMLLMRRGGSRPVRANRDPFVEDRPSDVINMARIRVAGFGGLGMIVVAITLAFVYPRIGDTVLLGVAGGVVAAGFVILYRRQSGPLASGDNGVGGRSVFVGPDDDDEPTPATRGERPALRRGQSLGVPAHVASR